MTVLPSTQPRARPRPPSWTPPTRLSSLVFAGKMAAFRLRRTARDLVDGPPRLAQGPMAGAAVVAGESVTPLWSDERLAERAWQLGKVQNLRVACRALDGLMIPAGAVFSFWRHVGPPVTARGFVRGRMLQQGCLTPAVGGGLCQLSNALYEAALQAGCRIVERHPHSRIVPGSAAAWGRDATVAWNYVDLRFAPPGDLRLVARLTGQALVVRLMRPPQAGAAPATAPGESARPDAAARTCGTCEETECFLHEHDDRAPPAVAGRRAFLVDEAWPELQAHVAAERRGEDRLGLPLDGARWRLARYAWFNDGFATTVAAPLAALSRSAALRSAGLQGAARRGAELAGAQRIAAALARRLLSPDVTELVVAQAYLPFLHRAGHLGGRDVSVLMTRLPMAVLQARLDAAAEAHPGRATLSDYRAPAGLAEAEAEALAQATRIVTPHAEIAALFGPRAVLLDWQSPPPSSAGRPSAAPGRIAFPGPTVARKGAHAVRAAALALDLEVVLLGAELEGADFWTGVRTQRPADADWRTAVAVVQPALVEDQPRRLLAALAAGLPVIATPACGLTPRLGLTLVPAGDETALIAALAVLMG
ncbi:VanW family protein [Caulobacter sp. KR2-114]|uniref:VanW family protein n=1 Tax=Caulobacter sp. KR2-114 TaxID=3400912 RepID=UPI003C0D361B